MTLDIPTLQHNIVQLDRDSETLNKQIVELTQQINQGQAQLALLHGAREYNVLTLKRAKDTLAEVQAAAAAVSPTA